MFVKGSIICSVVCVICLGFDESLAARGGGRGGGSRGSSSRSSSRSSSSRSSQTNVNVRISSHTSYSRRPWGSGYSHRSWRSYGSSGYIYGYVYYTRTRHYHDNPEREPQICSNEYDYQYENGSFYQLFICPMADQSEDYNYCCGDEDRQTCCRFWDSGLRVFGAFVCPILFMLAIAITVYRCCFYRPQPHVAPFFQTRVLSRRMTSQNRNVQYTVGGPGQPAVEISPLMSGPTACYPQTQQPLYPVSPPGQMDNSHSELPAPSFGPNDTSNMLPPGSINEASRFMSGPTASYPQTQQPLYPVSPLGPVEENTPQSPVGAASMPTCYQNYPPYPVSASSPPPPYQAQYPEAQCPSAPYPPPVSYPASYPAAAYQSVPSAPAYQSQGVPPYSASPAPSYTQ